MQAVFGEKKKDRERMKDSKRIALTASITSMGFRSLLRRGGTKTYWCTN